MTKPACLNCSTKLLLSEQSTKSFKILSRNRPVQICWEQGQKRHGCSQRWWEEHLLRKKVEPAAESWRCKVPPHLALPYQGHPSSSSTAASYSSCSSCSHLALNFMHIFCCLKRYKGFQFNLIRNPRSVEGCFEWLNRALM